MSYRITHFHQSLALRPLLWIAPAVFGGCALGAAWAGFLEHQSGGNATRDVPLFWLPLIAAALLGILCWRWNRQKYFWAARGAAALAIAASFCTYCARRVLPPSHDISRLVHRAEQQARHHSSALKKVPVQLRGYVNATPHAGDYAQEFPLKSTFAQSGGKVLLRQGNVWVQAPLDWDIKPGDLVEINAGLRDLPQPGAATEPSQNWRYVLHHCWSMVKLGNGDSWHTLSATPPPRYWLEAKLADYRKRLLHRYNQRFSAANVAYPRATAQLMVAMVFGDGALSAPLPWLVRENFRAAGLTHLLVASGTQVSLLVLLILGLFKMTGLRRFPWLALAILLALLTVYALLVGGASSIWRAFIAGICVAVALLLGRPIDVLSLWCFAAAALLTIDPLQIFDLSFQLTFAATWGLIVLAPAFLRWLKRRFKSTFAIGVCNAGAFTLAAQLATLPLLLYHFKQFYPAGLLTNFVGIPIAGFLVGCGIVGILVPWLTAPNAFLTHLMFHLTASAGSWKSLQFRDISLTLGGVAMCYFMLCAFPTMEEVKLILQDEWRQITHRWQQRWGDFHWLRALVWGIALGAMIWAGWFFLRRPADLQIALLDVGQGECIFIQTPSGHHFLIDGGTLSSAEHGKVGNAVILPYLQAHGVRHLDAVLLTHADADHTNALDEVMDEVPVKLFLDGSGQRLPSGEIKEADLAETDYWTLRQQVKTHHVPRKLAHAGQQLKLDDGVLLQILAPQRPALVGDNNRSMAVKLIYGKTSFLFTGDMEAEEETQLVRRGVNLRCTVLKVAHHGSASSSTPAFLRAAQPAAAIISCGRYNPFGHPATPTLERLKKHHIPYFRTDLNGTIEINSDGKRCHISTFR